MEITTTTTTTEGDTTMTTTNESICTRCSAIIHMNKSGGWFSPAAVNAGGGYLATVCYNLRRHEPQSPKEA